MKKTLSFSFLFVLLASFTVLTKHEILEKIHNKLDLYFTENFPEKIYIHTDKPYYSLDESIWFTGYMVNGITHTKSSKSAVFYVELINEKDSIVSKKKFYSTHIFLRPEILKLIKTGKKENTSFAPIRMI